MEDRDFIDFEFNGHWASEFNLLAVSNSDRYSNSFYGTVNANTVDMVGKYGVYKWKTQIGEKRFSINIAYDNVDLNTLRKIKEWLNPFVIGKLVFKEEPYKYYWVSLAEDPEISFLPFLTEETVVDGRRLKKGVYKGEFVINFVCFDNYGYSDWNSFDENYDYIVKELEISDDEVNFDDGSDNSLIISQIDGNLKQNKESQAYYSTSQESNRLTLNNITNTDTEKWSIKGGNNQVVQNYNSTRVEGESFNLNDVDNSKTMDIQLKGNHNQETREGYNKFKPFDSSSTVNSNGTTVKIQNEKIIINGVCTRQWWCEIYYRLGDGTAVQTDKKENLDSSKTYTFGLQRISGNITQGYINATVVIDENDKQIGGPAIATNNKNGTSKTFTGGNGIYRAYLYIPQNAVFNNLEFGVLIYEGSETKDWQQYGATPSLKFPSEIKAVGSNINVLNNTLQSQTINGLTVTVNEDKSVKVVGTAASNTNIIFDRHDGKIEAGTYTLKDCQTFIESEENKGWWRTGETKTFTSTANISSNGFYKYYESGTTVDETLYPMVVNGTVATSYVQYKQGSANVVVCNKNKLKLTEISEIPGISVSKNNGKLVLNGTATSTNDSIKIGTFYAKKDETYILSITNKILGFGVNLNNNKVGIAENLINITKSSTAKVSKAAIATDNGKVDVYIAINKDTVFNNFEVEIQIEENTTATSIIEHQEQAITMPVQQEMLQGDYFDWKNEKQTNLFEKIVLDGVNKKCDIARVIGDASRFQWRFTVTDTNYDNRRIYSNVATQCNSYGQKNGMVLGTNNNVVYINSDISLLGGKEATAENVNEILKTMYDNGNPAIFYIEKANNKELDFTDEQKAVAKQFKAITPYKDITHIYSTDEIKPKMVVDYNITREMPSLDYPSEIKTVGGNINLFDKNNMNIIDGAFINSSTKKIEANVNRKCFYIKIKPNEAYTISRKKVASMFAAATTNEIPTINSDILDINYSNQKEFTITASSNANYLVCYYKTKANDDESEIVDKIKIEKGIVASSYSEYGKGCISITVYNKNLFKEISNNKKINTAYGFLISGNYMLEKGKKYAVSFDTNNNGGKVYLNENVLKFVGSIYDAACDGKRHTIIATAIVDGFQRNRNLIKTGVATTDYYDVSNVSVYEYVDSGSSDFVEHQEQVFSMPVQQDMLEGDYFDFDREKEVHNWGKSVFDENDNVVCSHNDETFQFRFERILENTSASSKTLCNISKYWRYMWNENGCFVSYQKYFYILCKENEFGFNADMTTNEAISHLKEKLTQNNLICYYQLTTPTELDFTNEQKTVARQLKRSNFYKGTTNIILDNDLAKVKVNYDGYDGAPSEKHPSSVDGVKDKVDIIISNQNLFNFNKLNTSNSNLTIANNKLNGNNSIAIIGASGDSKGLLNKILVPGTYTVSFDILSKTDNWISSAFLCCQNLQKVENYANGISVNLIANEKKRASFQFEVKEKMTQFGIVFYLSKTSEYEVSNITVVKGTEEDYIEYKQQQISLPVQEEMYIGDYIDETGEHHKMAKIVIDGTNTRVSMTKKVANFIQTFLNTSQQFDPQVDINCYSNIMNQEYNGRFGFINTFIKSKAGIYFHFKGDLLGDADCNDIGMNNWFKEQYDKGTPAYIIGPLKKEKVLPLTDEQKSALNVLKNYTYSYPGANTISISGDTKPKITASYIPQQDINIDFILEGSNLLNDSAFYYNNDIYLKAFDEIDSGNPSTSGISSEREVYLYNAGNADASLKLTFDLIIPVENSPLTIITSKGRFTKNGFEEINNYSQFSISNFAHYKPFVDIFDGILSNWVIEINSDLCEVYLKHKTNKDKVISLNRFNDNQSFLKLAGSDFVDYSKSFPTSLEEIKDSAIENTIFNKISLKESAQNYRLKNVSLDWKHTYL